MDVKQIVVPILQYVFWSGGIGMLRSIAKYVRKPENTKRNRSSSFKEKIRIDY